ncbi:hypothetical protein ACFY19_18705 [Streptosporangium saharense]|uniref:hypothetical protein n=1 Tax=Streptosporangium saharense TaxID=1706840 RepID=UPI003677C241
MTAITGGEGYSTVPDLCTLNVDIRLTPALELRGCVTTIDAAWPGTQRSLSVVTEADRFVAEALRR